VHFPGCDSRSKYPGRNGSECMQVVEDVSLRWLVWLARCLCSQPYHFHSTSKIVHFPGCDSRSKYPGRNGSIWHSMCHRPCVSHMMQTLESSGFFCHLFLFSPYNFYPNTRLFNQLLFKEYAKTSSIDCYTWRGAFLNK
jgi:hypothetical protein